MGDAPEERDIEYVREGGAVPSSGSKAVEAPAPRPNAGALVPIVLNFLMRQDGQEHTAVVAQVLSEVLSAETGERFVQLVDERVGPRVAPRLAAMRRRGMSLR